MIRVRKSSDRRIDSEQGHDAWVVFSPEDRASGYDERFDALELFKEDRLPPRARAPSRWQLDAEIVTYVREGSLGYQDSTGRSGIIQSGEFQRMTTGGDVHYEGTNSSPTAWAHVFQIWLRSGGDDLEPGHEEKRFSAADRHGVLCLVASPNSSIGSLQVHQDVRIYSSILETGRHITHALPRDRCAWLHVVQGDITVNEAELVTGDGAGITDELAVSFTAREQAEILLLDLGGERCQPAKNRVVQ